MPLDAGQDAIREQKRAQAINDLRTAKQFIVLTIDLEAGKDGEGDVTVSLAADGEFLMSCADYLMRYALAMALAPEAMGAVEIETES